MFDRLKRTADGAVVVPAALIESLRPQLREFVACHQAHPEGLPPNHRPLVELLDAIDQAALEPAVRETYRQSMADRKARLAHERRAPH